MCAAATHLSGRVDLGLEILPPRPRNGVATHGHDGGAAASEGGDDEVALRKRPLCGYGTRAVVPRGGLV